MDDQSDPVTGIPAPEKPAAPDRVFVDIADLGLLRDHAMRICSGAQRAKGAIYTGMITTTGMENALDDLFDVAQTALALHRQIRDLKSA